MEKVEIGSSAVSIKGFSIKDFRKNYFSHKPIQILRMLSILMQSILRIYHHEIALFFHNRDRMSDYQAMVAELRNAGVKAELYLGSSGMKPQLKYADRRQAPVVVIQGSDEFEKGEVTLKDLILGSELAKNIEDNKRNFTRFS